MLGKIKGSSSAALGKIKEGGSTILSTAKQVPQKVNELLGNLMEEVAYFFVSIVFIPIVVLLLLVVFLKQMLGFKSSGSGDYKALIKEMRKMIPAKHASEE